MKAGKPILFVLLVIAFLSFSASIYVQPARVNNSTNHEQAVRGRLVWQQYNCQGCHQLYGLGGYLGPDLTNVYSDPGKGTAFVKAMVRSGTTQMPAFDLSSTEEEDLVAFLRQTDAAGSADPRDFAILNNGMIEAR